MADDGIKRVTIRFSYEKKEHHRKAYEIMEEKPNSSKNEFIIQAIIEKEEGLTLAEVVRSAVREELSAKNIRMSGFEEQLRKIMREELAHVSFVQPTVQAKKETGQQPREPENAIPSDAMDFMNKLG